ncbi:hypothetical protein Tco_0765236 [Tanacetum coccineum]
MDISCILFYVNVKSQGQPIRGLLVAPKSRVVYKPIQPMTVKNSDIGQAKSKDRNSTKVANNNSSSKIMANMASSYGTKRNSRVANYNETKIMTSNPFDFLKWLKSMLGLLVDTNETTSFMTPKLPKVTSSCMGRGGSGTSSLYECCKETIGDSAYDDDDKCEDLTPHQQTFCDVFDIRLLSNSRRGTKHAKVNNSKDDKNLPTSSSKDVLNTFNKYDLLSNEFDTFFEECKEDANATTGTSMDKSGKKSGTSEVDAVNVEMMERELPMSGKMLIVMKRVRLNMSMMKKLLLWHLRVPKMKALKVVEEWVIRACMKNGRKLL